MTSPIQEQVHWKRKKKHMYLYIFTTSKFLFFFEKSKVSEHLHFDSRRVVSVKSPHSSGTGTSGSSGYGSSSSPTGCSFSLTNGSTTTSSSWRSCWGTSSTSTNISSTCSWSRLEKIISTLIVLTVVLREKWQTLEIEKRVEKIST